MDQLDQYFWSARWDSNPQPVGYKPTALTIELQADRETSGEKDNKDSKNKAHHDQQPHLTLRCLAPNGQKVPPFDFGQGAEWTGTKVLGGLESTFVAR